MKIRSARRFACPDCKGDLTLDVAEETDGEVLRGTLRCAPCQRDYPITNGIPRLITELLAVEKHSSESFGYKFEKIAVIDDYLIKGFLDEIEPLDYDTFFKGKSVLDAGTGMGVPAYCMAKRGAAEVFGIDISATIDVARETTRDLPNANIAQANIFEIPFKRHSFDVVCCVAVLQHTRDPRKAFDELLSFVKPGGTIVIWVYGYEGNAFARWFIEPFRKLVTRKLPLPVVMGMSHVLAVIFHFLAKCVYKPFTRLGLKGLPMQNYITYRADFNYKINMIMIFDQLLAPLSYLFRKEEVADLFERPEIASYVLRQHTGNSWTGVGTVKNGENEVKP